MNEKTKQAIMEISWEAWKAAANAYRLYPNHSHTFIAGYWSDGKKKEVEKKIEDSLK